MKLLFVLPVLGESGSKIVTHAIAGGLSARHEVTVLLFWEPRAHDRKPGIRYRTIGVQGYYRDQRARILKAIVGELSEGGYDAVFAVLDGLEMLAWLATRVAALRRGPLVPCVFTIHSGSAFLGGLPPRERLGAHLHYGLCLRAFDRVIAVSRGVREDWARTFRTGRKIDVIANPLDTDLTREQAREACRIPYLAGCTNVLYVGRLARQKNLPCLLEAFRIAAAEEAGLHLTLVGDGEERPLLERLVHDKGLESRVVFTGHEPNPYPYIAGADLLALSSDHEGLPTVLLEAMCLGVKSVSTDCPWGPAEILEGGRLGTLVPMNDPPALARGMLEGLRRGSPSGEELRREAEKYSLAAVIPAYEALLAGSAAGSGKGDRHA